MFSALLLGAMLVQDPDAPAIIRSRCASCHRPGGDAPFSLETIDEMRRRASMIVAVTKSRYMPPWKPVEGDFIGSRRLTDREIATIERWAGAVSDSEPRPSRRSAEGAKADCPPPSTGSLDGLPSHNESAINL